MPERQRIPLVFGQGLDRQTGTMAVKPASMEDLRNVILFDGKVAVRKGMALKQSFTDDLGNAVDQICLIHPLRTERVGVVVGYKSDTGKVFVYRVDPDGTNPTIIERSDGAKFWFQLDAGSDAPRIIAADTYGKVFLAHDEQIYSNRKQTYYYDSGKTSLQPLVANLNNTTDAPVKFRGVAKYLDYLVGWGYGTDSPEDRDRPEIVRTSLPGQPTEFNAEHYFIAGQRGDPVLACTPTSATLVVHKETESYKIIGFSPQNFGIQPIDPLFGVVASRLSVNAGGVDFFWSQNGPRVIDGTNPSQDIGQNLDLDGQEPLTLVDPGEQVNGFAFYLPSKRVVLFVFGRRVYALDVRSGEGKWAYWELGFTPFCAGILFGGETGAGSLVTAPTGHPEATAFDNTITPWTIGDTSATSFIKNVGSTGGEKIEAWIHYDAAWHNCSVTDVAASERQAILLTYPTAGATYDVAYRYRRANQYTAGYTDPDPYNWPGVSQTTFTATATRRTIGDPGDTSSAAVWSRTSNIAERITLTWSSGNPAADTDVEVSTDGTTWGAPTTVATPTSTYVYAVPGGEVYYWFRVRSKLGGVFGPYSNVVKVWAGPTMPKGYNPDDGTYAQGLPPQLTTMPLVIDDPFAPGYGGNDNFNSYMFTDWRKSPDSIAGWQTEVYYDGVLGATVAYTVEQATVIKSRQATHTAKLRHKWTQFTVADYSDYTPEGSIDIP